MATALARDAKLKTLCIMQSEERSLMKTQCNGTQLVFHGFGRRRVVGRFDGGKLSSDGGGLLLREVEQRC
ncbi:MAG: hypothetical protein ACRD04_05465, partial [Terriglobales bacterium]